MQIILTTFQAEPLSLFSEFSTIVMVDCSFSSYTYMNGLHTGPEKDKLYQNPVNPILHFLKIFEAIDNFKKEWNYFLFMIFGPSTFWIPNRIMIKDWIESFYLFIYYNFYLFFKPGPTVDCIVLHGFIVVANNDETWQVNYRGQPVSLEHANVQNSLYG